MDTAFYLASFIAIAATAMTITRLNAMHALLYLIVSLLAVAVVFYSLGAPFIAALEVIIYAGAIMVLFVFAVMTLNLGKEASAQERRWLAPNPWKGPGLLSLILLAELIYLILQGGGYPGEGSVIAPKRVGISLFGPYLLAVELASMLLLAGLVGAYHLGRRESPGED